MIERRTLCVSLTPELFSFASGLVKDGAYGNSSEVVRAGLRLLCHEEDDLLVALRRSASTLKEPQGSRG